MNNKLINLIVFAVGAAVGSLATWKVMKDKQQEDQDRLEELTESIAKMEEMSQQIIEREEARHKRTEKIMELKSLVEDLKKQNEAAMTQKQDAEEPKEEDIPVEDDEKLTEDDVIEYEEGYNPDQQRTEITYEEEYGDVDEEDLPPSRRYVLHEKFIKDAIFTDTSCDCRLIAPEEFGCKKDYDSVFLVYYADGVLTDEWDNIIENVETLVGQNAFRYFGHYDDEPDLVYVRNDCLRADFEIGRDLRISTEVERVVKQMERNNDKETKNS